MAILHACAHTHIYIWLSAAPPRHTSEQGRSQHTTTTTTAAATTTTTTTISISRPIHEWRHERAYGIVVTPGVCLARYTHGQQGAARAQGVHLPLAGRRWTAGWPAAHACSSSSSSLSGSRRAARASRFGSGARTATRGRARLSSSSPSPLRAAVGSALGSVGRVRHAPQQPVATGVLVARHEQLLRADVIAARAAAATSVVVVVVTAALVVARG